MLTAALSFLGRHARLALPSGIVIALLLPDIDARWDIILPLIITAIYAASMIRLDLRAALVSALRPSRLLFTIFLSSFILCAVPVIYVVLGRLFGLDALLMPSLVWYAVAPPIASTVWMCTLLGFNAGLAMEVIVLTSLAAPFTGPALASIFLHDVAVIDQLALLGRLAGMIIGGTVIALIAQRLLGREKIEQNAKVFDGLSSLAMLVFLLPVFNGTGTAVWQTPGLAFQLLLLAVVMNIGAQIILMLATAIRTKNKPRERQGAALPVLAVVTGNRNVGLYFAALPPDPVFALFTAMYQIPLYLTPLILSSLDKWICPRPVQ